MIKQQEVYTGKTTTLHVHHAFLYISLPPLHDYAVNMPNRLERWTGNSEAPSLSSALTASWICSRQFRVQILDHPCK